MKNVLKVIVNGASGKMGRYAMEAIQQADDMNLVAALGRQDDLSQTIAKTHADIVVDFTTPEAVYANTRIIIEKGAHPVIGTTGLSDEQIKNLQKLCQQKKIGGMIAPNFSIGVNLMLHFAKQAAQFFNHIEIIEMHHPAKKDAPSGTAKKTAQLIGKQVPIHSVRLPGLVAHQKIIFGATGETLTIQHDCIDRIAYMQGLLWSCRKVMGLDELVYGLENLLFS